MISILCSWFDDWGIAIKDGIGTTGVICFLVAFAFISFWLIYKILAASINKPKIVFAWFHIVLLIIMILFIVWFSIILSF